MSTFLYHETFLKTINVFIYLFCISRATPAAYRGSQARGLIGAVAVGLCQSHSNARSKPLLRPTPQLTATQFVSAEPPAETPYFLIFRNKYLEEFLSWCSG